MSEEYVPAGPYLSSRYAATVPLDHSNNFASQSQSELNRDRSYSLRDDQRSNDARGNGRIPNRGREIDRDPEIRERDTKRDRVDYHYENRDYHDNRGNRNDRQQEYQDRDAHERVADRSHRLENASVAKTTQSSIPNLNIQSIVSAISSVSNIFSNPAFSASFQNPPIASSIPSTSGAQADTELDFDYGDEDDEYLNRKSKNSTINAVAAALLSKTSSIPLPDPAANQLQQRDSVSNAEIPSSDTLRLSNAVTSETPSVLPTSNDPSFFAASSQLTQLNRSSQSFKYQSALEILEGSLLVKDTQFCPDGHSIVASTTVWVGGLPPGSTENQVQTSFREHGNVVSVKLNNSDSGFVVLESRLQAENARFFYTTQTFHGHRIKTGWGKPAAIPKSSFLFLAGLSIVSEAFLANFRPLQLCDLSLTPYHKEIRDFLLANYPDIGSSRLPPQMSSNQYPGVYNSSGNGNRVPRSCNMGANCHRIDCKFTHPTGWNPQPDRSGRTGGYNECREQYDWQYRQNDWNSSRR